MWHFCNHTAEQVQESRCPHPDHHAVDTRLHGCRSCRALGDVVSRGLCCVAKLRRALPQTPRGRPRKSGGCAGCRVSLDGAQAITLAMDENSPKRLPPILGLYTQPLGDSPSPSSKPTFPHGILVCSVLGDPGCWQSRCLHNS